MVDDSSPVFGLDKYRESTLLAQVVVDAGREKIVSLREVTSEEIGQLHSQEETRLVTSIPDRAVIVKRLLLPETLSVSVADFSRFEIEQSLLDQPNEFSIDYYHSDQQPSVLAFAVRKNYLRDCLSSQGLGNGSSIKPDIGCRTRALALGLGYLAFCDSQPGRVTGLADVTESAVSLCLIHDRRLVMVSHLNAESYDPQSYDGRHRLAIELKTVVNYLTESSRSADVSQPLSHLLMSGPALTSELEEVIGSYFPGNVSRPKINAGFLANPAEIDNIMAERFLVALGLTVR